MVAWALDPENTVVFVGGTIAVTMLLWGIGMALREKR